MTFLKYVCEIALVKTGLSSCRRRDLEEIFLATTIVKLEVQQIENKETPYVLVQLITILLSVSKTCPVCDPHNCILCRLLTWCVASRHVVATSKKADSSCTSPVRVIDIQN